MEILESILETNITEDDFYNNVLKFNFSKCRLPQTNKQPNFCNLPLFGKKMSSEVQNFFI